MYARGKLRQMYLLCFSIKGAFHSCQEVAAGDCPAEVFLPVVDHWCFFAVERGKTRGTTAVKAPSEIEDQGVNLHQLLKKNARVHFDLLFSLLIQNITGLFTQADLEGL